MNPSDSLQLDENLARLLAAFDPGLAGGDDQAPTIEVQPVPPFISEPDTFSAPLVSPPVNRVPFADLISDSSQSRNEQDATSDFALTPAPLPSTHRIGRFELRKQLGKGGCGIVFLAFDPKLRREVALKIPRPEMLMSADAKRRLMREAEAAAEFDHPNLVPVYETGEIGPVCFIATAFCPGFTLAEWLEKQAFPVPVRQAARLVSILAEAVQHAHDRGVLHRDLKPNNVILQGIKSDPNANEGPPPGSCPLRGDHYVPRIVDFGLAKLSERGPSETVTRQILGTPKYMAPEQAQGLRHDIGPQADVYALGVILYEILAGRTPYEGSTDVEVLRQSIEGNLTPPRHVRADVPRDLEAICLKAMSKSPARRYRTAIDFADDLQRYLTGLPTLARPLNRLGRVARWIRRNDQVFAFIVLATVCCILFAIGAFNLYQTQELKTARENDRLEQLERMRLDQRQSYARQVHDAFLAWRSGNTQQMGELLEEARISANNSGDPCDFTWSYLNRMAHAGQLTIVCPAGPVTALALSNNGRRLISGHEDGTVALWNRASGKSLGVVKASQSAITQVAFALHGKQLFTLSAADTQPGRLRAWTISPAGALTSIAASDRAEEFDVAAIAVDPSEKAVYIAQSRGVLIRRSLQQSEPDSRIEVPAGLTTLAFSTDGQSLYAGWRSGQVRRWSATLEPLESGDLSNFGAGVTALALAAGNEPLVGYTNGIIRSFPRDLPIRGPFPSDRVRWLFRGSRIGYSTNAAPGRITFEGSDLATGDVGTVRVAAQTQDRTTLFTAGDDGVIRSWNANTDLRDRAAFPVGRVRSVRVQHDGSSFIVAGSRLLRLSDGNATPLNAEGSAEVQDVQVLADRTIRTVAFAGSAIVVTDRAGPWQRKPITLTIPDSRLPTSVSLSVDGLQLAVGDDLGRVSFWSVSDRKHLGTIDTGTRRPVTRVRYSENGKYVGVASASGVAVRSINEWKVIASMPSDEQPTFCFLPEGDRVAVTDHGGIVRVWTLTGQTDRMLLGHVGRITGLGISADGRTLVSGCANGVVKFWDMRTGQELMSQRRHSSAVSVIVFAANGRSLITAGEGQLAVWDASTK